MNATPFGTGSRGLGVLGAFAVTLFLIAVAFQTSLYAALAGATAAAVPTVPVATPVTQPLGKGLPAVVGYAASQLGKPYVWGGASPATSFDCSGLVQWSYAQVGISLPRTAQAQYDATVPVAPSAMQPGDLVFFANTYPSSDWVTHVGIYIGNGQMINAANPSQGIVVLPLADPYWAAHAVGARRPAAS